MFVSIKERTKPMGGDLAQDLSGAHKDGP